MDERVVQGGRVAVGDEVWLGAGVSEAASPARAAGSPLGEPASGASGTAG